MPAASLAPTLHRFAHEAMATTFEVILAAKTSAKETALYTAQAARGAAAFTSSPTWGSYWAKFSTNMRISLAACAS